MRDNEIIKALECCVGFGLCHHCPHIDSGKVCLEVLHRTTLDLINRQKTEIKKLKQDNDILSRNADTAFQDGLNESEELYKNEVETEIKSEAIKEFAERLKEKAFDLATLGEVIRVETIDNLVNEMTEEKENAIESGCK